MTGLTDKTSPAPTKEEDDCNNGADLPREEAALRVRHHGEVTAVLRAEAGDAVGRAVGVERIRFGGTVGVIDEPVNSTRDNEIAAAVE